MSLATLTLAYLGPGGALSAIGSFLALLAAVGLAVVGFVWYPVKRMLRARRAQDDAANGSEAAEKGSEA